MKTADNSLLDLADAQECKACKWPHICQMIGLKKPDGTWDLWVYCAKCSLRSPKVNLFKDVQTRDKGTDKAVRMWNEGQQIKDKDFILSQNEFKKGIRKQIAELESKGYGKSD